jgi:hypothetical protein
MVVVAVELQAATVCPWHRKYHCARVPALNACTVVDILSKLLVRPVLLLSLYAGNCWAAVIISLKPTVTARPHQQTKQVQ